MLGAVRQFITSELVGARGCGVSHYLILLHWPPRAAPEGWASTPKERRTAWPSRTEACCLPPPQSSTCGDQTQGHSEVSTEHFSKGYCFTVSVYTADASCLFWRMFDTFKKAVGKYVIVNALIIYSLTTTIATSSQKFLWITFNLLPQSNHIKRLQFLMCSEQWGFG